jgi:hypothetical protein
MSNRQTQAARILQLLESTAEVSALDLSKISLQYCARIAELRDAGAVIANRVAVQSNGVRHGFYRLVSRSPFREKVAHPIEPGRKPPNSAPGLFPENEIRTVETQFQYPD